MNERCYAQCASADRCTVATRCPYQGGGQAISDPALLPDPDYTCGAAYCDDPACNTHRPGTET